MPIDKEGGKYEFETATAMLAGKAKDGDLNAIKAQFGKVAQNCKSCHTNFRKKK